MKNLCVLAVILLSVGACSTPPVAGETRIAGSEPGAVEVSGEWQFEVTEKQGIRNPVVMLTQEPAETCLSGDWYKAVAVSPSGLAFSTPAYNYSDGRLELLLSSEFCDAYTSLIGSVSGGRFDGTYVSYGMFGSTEHGKVTGARRR